MRIAQICPYDIERPGGVQRHILDLSSSLAAMGHEVTVIAPRALAAQRKPCDKIVRRDVPIIQIGHARLVADNKTAFEISLALGDELKKLDGLMRASGFDVVNFHTPLSPLLAIQALGRSTSANVGTFHAVPPETASGSIQRFLYKTLNRRIIASMDGAILASSVQEDLGLAGAVLPPCINLRRFGRVTAPLESFEGEAVNILFLGRLEPRKGVSVLLKAYGLLRRGGQAARLLIAGEGPDRQRLERLAATEGIPDVVFLGRIEDVDLPSLYATCDIFCAPSTDGEGFGIVLVEAMASGKPVVAAANAGYRSVLHGEAASLLARPSDVSDLQSKLEMLVKQPALRSRLGEWGRGEALRYDSNELAPAFISVYENAMRSRKSRSLR